MPNPLANVKTWAYVINNVGAKKATAIGALAVDLVVVDSEDRWSNAFDAADIAVMKGAGGKQVISYLSIGEAETYRDYWQPDWDSAPPVWLAAGNPEWEGNIKVAYWNTDWQEIVFGMVDGIVDAGFDGLYLDIIDAYGYWEEAAPQASPEFYRDAMIDFVAAIRARAEARMADTDTMRDFAIIGQNGEDLATDPDYLAVVDGIGKEDLYFYYPHGAPGSFREVPKGWLSGSKALLEAAEAAGVETFFIEYVPMRFRDEVIGRVRDELAYLKGLDAPLYLSSDRALTQIELSVDSAGRVHHWGGGQDDNLRGTPWNDTMDGADGDDTLHGRAGRDDLNGGAGRDALFGGRWRDRLDGGSGKDNATGGGGADLFVFSPGDERLRVTDFGRGHDRLDLTDLDLADWAALREAGQQRGERLVFTFDNDHLVLAHTTWSDLDPGNVLL